MAHGSGNADRDVVDARQHVRVPPEAPSYTLRRVWLPKRIEEEYYYGLANEGLWPLCHAAFHRPRFSQKNWDSYRIANQLFAEAILEEAGGSPALVFIQDYHLGLLAPHAQEQQSESDGRSVLAYSVAQSRDVPGVSLEGGAAGWHARERPARIPSAVSLRQLPRNH